MGIKHATQTSRGNNPNKDVSATAWEEAHIIEDESISEAKLILADNTTNNVSITKHGLVPRAPNITTKFLRGDGTWDTVVHTHVEADVTDLDHDAGKIVTKTVDDAAIANDKILVYKTATDNFVFEAQASGGGVSSVGEYGDGTTLTGDVKLEEGTNVTITRSDPHNSLIIAASGGSGEPHNTEDYLVFMETAVWKARNGNNGNIDYSNALIEEVLQDIMGALTGTYPHLIVIKGNV